ncbi:hypothetical protein QBC42DRAFT_257281 [Cladorrhinum samala]|uniref:Uncharacterized protein n=1 Tax=Cladorrhinum samala TaxID=585594 RepID=A0AAV9H7D0_9PEZI|nr:hypothetical protein QBC42DRAFT_257281 [Cladorrhinum samala]
MSSPKYTMRASELGIIAMVHGLSIDENTAIHTITQAKHPKILASPSRVRTILGNITHVYTLPKRASITPKISSTLEDPFITPNLQFASQTPQNAQHASPPSPQQAFPLAPDANKENDHPFPQQHHPNLPRSPQALLEYEQDQAYNARTRALLAVKGLKGYLLRSNENRFSNDTVVLKVYGFRLGEEVANHLEKDEEVLMRIWVDEDCR